jgi:hypothetical protein
METVFYVFMFFLDICIFVELVTILFCGTPIKKSKLEKFINSEIFNNYRINSFDYRMLSYQKLPYITTLPFSILFSYHIEDNGVVFRWSKESNIIKQKMKEERLNNPEINENDISNFIK